MLHYYTRTALCSATLVSLLSTPAAADAPRVVTDIAPVHSLVAAVMEGVATPDLIVPPTASPHGFSMRPSQAAAIEKANLVFWMGKELTPWLETSLDNLAQGADIVALLDAEGTKTHAYRSIEQFIKAEGQDDHDDHKDHDDHGDEEHAEHKEHDDHGEEEHAEHKEHDDHEEHAEHDDHGDEDHAEHKDHDDHGEEEHAEHDEDKHDDHDHDGVDPHAWLDPANAVTWITLIADRVSAVDPENAATYAQNAKAAIAQINTASAAIEAKLEDTKGLTYIVFHDAYQYFEHRFDMQASGSISLGDASKPSPARLSQIRGILEEKNVTCVFTEAQYNTGLVDTVIEGTSVKTAEIDPHGATQTEGPTLYLGVLNGLADQFASCLKP